MKNKKKIVSSGSRPVLVCPQVQFLLPLPPSVSSSAISESINKTWWDRGKTGTNGGEGRERTNNEEWETASLKQELFWPQWEFDSKHCLGNIPTDLSVLKSMIRWRYLTKERVHIQGVKKKHNIHKCTDLAAGWRLSPFSQGSFMQICRRPNTVWSVTVDFAWDPRDVNSTKYFSHDSVAVRGCLTF